MCVSGKCVYGSFGCKLFEFIELEAPIWSGFRLIRMSTNGYEMLVINFEFAGPPPPPRTQAAPSILTGRAEAGS